jgi:hypothetical protein
VHALQMQTEGGNSGTFTAKVDEHHVTHTLTHILFTRLYAHCSDVHALQMQTEGGNSDTYTAKVDEHPVVTGVDVVVDGSADASAKFVRLLEQTVGSAWCVYTLFDVFRLTLT